MMQTLNKMKEKLEKESSEHRMVKQQVADLSTRLHEMSNVCYCHFFLHRCQNIKAITLLKCVALVPTLLSHGTEQKDHFHSKSH